MTSRYTTDRRARRSIAIAIVALVVLLSLGGGDRGLAQQMPSATESVEVREMRAALEVAQRKLAEQQQRTAELEQRHKVLAQSLAAANEEAESHRKAYTELLLKLEGLGVDLLDPDPKGLESRLLKAVNDRQLLERELKAVTDQVFVLTEAFVSYMQTATSDDEAARQRITDELENIGEVFRTAGDPDADGVAERGKAIAEGRVVSRDPEIALVVLDVGKKSGVRVGMPLEILRKNRPIGSAMVVDVRDSVCGALVHDLISLEDDAKVGDRVRPMADTF